VTVKEIETEEEEESENVADDPDDESKVIEEPEKLSIVSEAAHNEETGPELI